MPNYTTNQLQDLLCHIVSKGLKHSPADQDIFTPCALLSSQHIAAALTECGIPAQSSVRQLLSAQGWFGDRPQGTRQVFSDLSGKVEVGGFVFSPEDSSFSTWENIVTNPIFLAIQTRENSLGMMCKWVTYSANFLPSTSVFSQDHVQTLVEIIKPWQAQVQSDILTALTSSAPAVKPAPFKM